MLGRRIHIVGVLAALVLLATACDWTQLWVTPALNGVSPQVAINPSNVASLHEVFYVPFTAHTDILLSGVSTANGILYADDENTLVAADLAGKTNCSYAGSPGVCQPLSEGYYGTTYTSTPAVANGLEYLTTDGTHGSMAAVDANGTTGCSGTPETCQPIFTVTPPLQGSLDASPLVSDGLVFEGGAVYDANGVNSCSGTPTVCQPLWADPNGRTVGPDTVSDGELLVRYNNGAVDVFKP